MTAPHVCMCKECSTGFDLECRHEKKMAGLLEIAKWVAAGHASCADIITKAQNAIAEAKVPPRPAPAQRD